MQYDMLLAHEDNACKLVLHPTALPSNGCLLRTCMLRVGNLLLSPAKHALHTPPISLRSVLGTAAELARGSL
jgi:hypothetical protein